MTRLWKLALLLRLYFLNHGRRRVVAEGRAIVGLTTYGSRLRTVFLAVESIARGSERPERLILWLANDELSRRLPRSLRRLQRRGLEIRYCDDYRSYKKVYPFAGSEPEHVRPYATADDDVLYPKGWLEGLCDAWSERPELVNGYRARRIRISGGVIAPYVEWEKVLDSHPSHSNFLTGVSGIIYPPAFLDRLREAGDRFQLLSPEADDVWLHHVALRASTMQRQVRSEPLEFPTIPFTQRSTLMATNVGAGMNDRQIASLYSQADIQRLSDS